MKVEDINHAAVSSLIVTKLWESNFPFFANIIFNIYLFILVWIKILKVNTLSLLLSKKKKKMNFYFVAYLREFLEKLLFLRDQ